MASFSPPNTFFNNINFNNDFFAIPNDSSKGVTLSFANSHYLLTSPGTTPTSYATATFFSGGVNIGYGVNNPMPGYLQVQYINCQYSMSIANVYSSILFENNVPLSTKYQSNLLASKFTLAKQYPPVSLTSDSTLFSAQAYGNGTYITTSSSVTASYNPYKAANSAMSSKRFV